MRLLLLEDQTDIRESIALRFQQAGFVVDQCQNASQAEGLALSFGFDVFIFDVRLPEGNDAGFEPVAIMKFLASICSTVPSALVTSSLFAVANEPKPLKTVILFLSIK